MAHPTVVPQVTTVCTRIWCYENRPHRHLHRRHRHRQHLPRLLHRLRLHYRLAFPSEVRTFRLMAGGGASATYYLQK